MTQFIQDGPDIPNALLHAHEEGNVVFFCGAGVSYPAGLPSFKGLVDEIYERLHEEHNESEEIAYKKEQFDITLNLLEARLQEGRDAILKKLPDILKPKSPFENTTKTHQSLLKLSRQQKGDSLRLITTNFDHCFEKASRYIKEPFQSYTPPNMPIPNKRMWNGLVYLHGHLPKNDKDYSLDPLVLTSGDFGLAYLVRRWASRFISELFCNYTVCFVGYSISDPILRYIMDALAADRALGNTDTLAAYAFCDHDFGQKEKIRKEWEGKGIVPILYEVNKKHSNLHNSLEKWADMYRKGTSGKESYIVQYAHISPSHNTPKNDFVGRVLWALSDKSGLPAQKFADHNPTPPLEWLDAFAEERYGRNDLIRFGVTPNHDDKDKKIKFSLIDRPAPYYEKPWMTLASYGNPHAQWDKPMGQIANWLLRYLNDPQLVLRLAQQGGHVHERFARMIKIQLYEFSQKSDMELRHILQDSPNAIPSPEMQKIWSWFIAGRIATHGDVSFSFYDWMRFFKRSGLTNTLKFQLRELLTPKIVLRRSWLQGIIDKEILDADEHTKKPSEWERITEVIEWEIVLTSDDTHYFISEHLEKENCWKEALPLLFYDFQQLLQDALELMGEGNIDRNHVSNIDIRSISPHPQNENQSDWITLVELLRNSWNEIYKCDRPLASQIAQNWFELPYITFKRLALYAASHDSVIPPSQWVDWLLTDTHLKDDTPLLWFEFIRRETMRLFVLQGHNLENEEQAKLETAILKGTISKKDRNYYTWLLLAKLNASGLELGQKSQQKLEELSHPDRKFKDNQKEEFSFWSEVTNKRIPSPTDRERAPDKRKKLVTWLSQEERAVSINLMFLEDGWKELCQKKLSTSLTALCEIAKDNVWPKDCWWVALNTWKSDKTLTSRSWRYAAPLISQMPDNILSHSSIKHSMAFWLEEVSSICEEHQDILLVTCKRILAFPPDSKDGETRNDAATQAINHPTGMVTGALLHLWFKRDKPRKDDNLPDDIKAIFTDICTTEKEHFRHGRLLLARQLITLFHVDTNWTRTHLLPFFDWECNKKENTKTVWEGFLWANRFEPFLFVELKDHFLKIATRYSDLDERLGQKTYPSLLTRVALHDPIDGYGTKDFKSSVEALPRKGKIEVANTLMRRLESMDSEKRANYWRQHIKPFWKKVWPQSKNDFNPNEQEQLSAILSRLCIASQDAFPDALDTMSAWLTPYRPDYELTLLEKSNLCTQFPKEALAFLRRVIKRTGSYDVYQLHICLKKIISSSPELEQDPDYIELDELCEQ